MLASYLTTKTPSCKRCNTSLPVSPSPVPESTKAYCISTSPAAPAPTSQEANKASENTRSYEHVSGAPQQRHELLPRPPPEGFLLYPSLGPEHVNAHGQRLAGFHRVKGRQRRALLILERSGTTDACEQHVNGEWLTVQNLICQYTLRRFFHQEKDPEQALSLSIKFHVV